jgi:hypothetical protein
MDQDLRFYEESLKANDIFTTLVEFRHKLCDGGGDHSHAWSAVWSRPMKIDERKLHPFTVARMTDHNVKGRD